MDREERLLDLIAGAGYKITEVEIGSGHVEIRATGRGRGASARGPRSLVVESIAKDLELIPEGPLSGNISDLPGA